MGITAWDESVFEYNAQATFSATESSSSAAKTLTKLPTFRMIVSMEFTLPKT